MSASLIAAVGYTAARAIDLHSEDIHVPRRFFFVYLFVVVLSFGVIWELFEFGLDVITDGTGFTMPLAQRGLDDTVRDIMFNSLGALLVAMFGQVHLTVVAETVRDRVFTGGVQPPDRAKQGQTSTVGSLPPLIVPIPFTPLSVTVLSSVGSGLNPPCLSVSISATTSNVEQ